MTAIKKWSGLLLVLSVSLYIVGNFMYALAATSLGHQIIGSLLLLTCLYLGWLLND
jgi:putative effector of murein hydrolase LrgA (UPF0299 family)